MNNEVIFNIIYWSILFSCFCMVMVGMFTGHSRFEKMDLTKENLYKYYKNSKKWMIISFIIIKLLNIILILLFVFTVKYFIIYRFIILSLFICFFFLLFSCILKVFTIRKKLNRLKIIEDSLDKYNKNSVSLIKDINNCNNLSENDISKYISAALNGCQNAALLLGDYYSKIMNDPELSKY